MVKVPRAIPEYYYQNLPETGVHIRLLKLEPGKREDFIHCHLEQVDLDEARGTYECVSYVWGDSEDLRRIIVDGHWFYVTLSLFQALQHFRSESEERTLWADAICIQQTNPPEKGRQVQLMGKIYQSSVRTLVWLGPDTDRTAAETVEFLQTTSRLAHEIVAKYGSVTKIPTLSADENPFSQDPAKWKLFENLLNFKWFSRVWVMQEVGIAPGVTMHWGDASIGLADIINVNEIQRHAPQLFEILPMSWNLHGAFVGLFMWYDNPLSWRNQVVPDFLTQGAVLVPAPNFIDALIQSSRRYVSDLRDHIYALLGHPLAIIGDETIVQADYSRHVDEVYTEVAAKLLSSVDPALALSVCGGMGLRKPRDLDDDNKPSWVTRWELCIETNNLGRPGQWFYTGGQDTKPDIRVDIPSKTLTTPAVIFDSIVWFSEQMHASDIEIDQIVSRPGHRSAFDWVWEDLPNEPCRYTGKYGSRDAFTLSLVSARYRHTNKAEDDMALHRRLARAYNTYLKSLEGGGKGIESTRADARDFENDFTWTSRERRFIVTKKGFYGLGPQLVKEGDVVAVFPGLRIPYILRPTEGDRKYKLVGAAYVHGVMRGEVLDAEDSLGLDAGGPIDIVIV